MAEVSNKQSPLEHKENAAKPRLTASSMSTITGHGNVDQGGATAADSHGSVER